MTAVRLATLDEAPSLHVASYEAACRFSSCNVNNSASSVSQSATIHPFNNACNVDLEEGPTYEGRCFPYFIVFQFDHLGFFAVAYKSEFSALGPSIFIDIPSLSCTISIFFQFLALTIKSIQHPGNIFRFLISLFSQITFTCATNASKMDRQENAMEIPPIPPCLQSDVSVPPRTLSTNIFASDTMLLAVVFFRSSSLYVYLSFFVFHAKCSYERQGISYG